MMRVLFRIPKDFPHIILTLLERTLLLSCIERLLSAVLAGEISLGFVRIQFLLLWKDSDKPIVPSADREIQLSAELRNGHPSLCQRT
jgi:hypothetical protein